MVISYRFGVFHKPFSFQLRGNSNSESGRVSISSRLTTESRGRAMPLRHSYPGNATWH